MAVKVGVIKNILGSKEVVVIDKNGNERVVVAGDSYLCAVCFNNVALV